MIHGALPKYICCYRPTFYLSTAVRGFLRCAFLRVFICLPVFRLALSRCERSQDAELEPRGQARGLLKGSMGEGDARC